MPAWSYSALTLFETCPKKYWHERVKKDIKGTTSSVGDYGLEAHKHFENRLLKGKSLPLDLQHHERVLAKIAEAPGEGMPEQKLALNANFEPTGFFDKDVWVRVIIDYVKQNGKVALIIDHKFGKMKSDFDQVELCAAAFSCFRPEVEVYKASYYWAKEKKLTSTTVHLAEVPHIWERYLDRVHVMDEAAKRDEYPAKPNGLCRRYCPVKSCPYNGV